MSVSSHRGALSTRRAGSTGQRHALCLLAFLMVSWLPALIGRGTVGSAAALFPLAAGSHPYFVLQHALLLYLLAPAVAISACILFLSPGLSLALALDTAQSVGRWVLSALALSLVVVSAAAGIVQGIMQTSLRDEAFALVVVVCALVSFAILFLRLRGGCQIRWPFDEPHAGFMAISMLVVPFVLLVALVPKFYWENFNGDGAHALETARLLLFQPLPFWDPAAGEVASWPGVTAMLYAFPTSWFIRLFGVHEASARLPYILHLAGLFAAVIELSEADRPHSLGRTERALIWLALAAYTLAMAFSATYSPYSADIALPATQDTLFMACLIGYLSAFVCRRAGWLVLFASLSILSLPTGSMLAGLWLLAVLIVWRPRPWRQVWLTAGTLVAWTVLAFLAPAILRALDLPSPGNEYGILGTLRYLTFLQWADMRRVLFVVVPAGIIPALALAAWRWQDRVARALTFVVVSYFLFFYVQAYTVLHHFVPAMILPLIVFWRTQQTLNTRRKPALFASVAVAGVAAVIISLPAQPSLDTSARRVGAAIEDRIGGYDVMDPATFRHSELLIHLFPYDWDLLVPNHSYGGSPVAWNYYAHHKNTEARETNYVIQAAAEPPEGMRLLEEEGGVALYVRNESVWAEHRNLRPSTPAGSRIYMIPRGLIFRSVPLDLGGPAVINVVDVLSRLGLDLYPLLDRFGIQH